MARMLKVEELKAIQQKPKTLTRADEQVITVKLPSKGKHGYSDVVHLRPLKVKDVKALVEDPIEGELDYVRRLVQVVQNTVLDEGFYVHEMTMPDFRKILVAHRVNSIGKDIDLTFRCTCRDEVQFIRFDLMKLEEKEIAEDYVEPVQVGNIQLRFPRVWGYLPEGKVSFDDVNDYDVLKSVVIGKEVDELLLSEAKAALEFVKKWENSYGVQTEVELPCRYCQKKVIVPVPFFLLISLW
jgi:hypothetical protein